MKDDAFDLDRHLRRLTAPEPGGMRELCEIVSRAAEPPLLARDRPLWEAWLVEGLQHGRLGVVLRMHHALADGVSSARMLAHWFQAGETRSVAPAGPAPTPLRFAAITARDGLRAAATDTRKLLDTARAARRARTRAEQPPPARPVAPAIRLNGALGNQRAFACVQLDLATAMAVKTAAAVTVNDVLLGLVAGALRTELKARGELPGTPLVAGVPVSRLAPELQEPHGNRGLTTMYMALPTNEEDPAVRLQAARTAALDAKAELARTAGARLDDVLGIAGRTAVRTIRPLLSTRLAARRPIGGNATVSNVRGPATALVADGFEIENFFSIGPCAPGCRLNVTAWSYNSHLNVSCLADPQALDPWAVLAALEHDLVDLASQTPAVGD